MRPLDRRVGVGGARLAQSGDRLAGDRRAADEIPSPIRHVARKRDTQATQHGLDVAGDVGLGLDAHAAAGPGFETLAMVPPPRIERGTSRATIWRSNQLS